MSKDADKQNSGIPVGAVVHPHYATDLTRYLIGLHG